MKNEIRRGRKAERRYIVTPDQNLTEKSSDEELRGIAQFFVLVRLRAVYQNVNFTPSCISRGDWATVSRPNALGCEISVLKPTKFVWLSKLKNSARNWIP